MNRRAMSAVVVLVIAAVTLGRVGNAPPGWVRFWLTAAIIAQLLPPLAVWVNRTGFDPARRWMAIWGVVYFCSDIAQILVSQSGANLWLGTIYQPLQDALLLWGLSFWQHKPVMRLTFRLAIPIHIAVTVALIVAAGEVETFKTLASPFRALVMLSAAAYTLVSRSAVEIEPTWKRDWLWSSLGVALYYGVFVVVEPVSARLLASGDTSSLVSLFVWKAAFDVLAFLLIWHGMRCPITPTFSRSGSVPLSP